MKTLSYQQLKQMKDQKEDFLLINVLPAEKVEEACIPGSMHIPLEQSGFEDLVEGAAVDKQEKIVIYSENFDCTAARRATENLDNAGFSNVYAYEGGTQEWQEKSQARVAA